MSEIEANGASNQHVARSKTRRTLIACAIAASAVAVVLPLTWAHGLREDIEELRRPLILGQVSEPGLHKFRELQGAYTSKSVQGGIMVTWYDAPGGDRCRSVIEEVAPSAGWVMINDRTMIDIKGSAAPLDLAIAEECHRKGVAGYRTVVFWKVIAE